MEQIMTPQNQKLRVQFAKVASRRKTLLNEKKTLMERLNEISADIEKKTKHINEDERLIAKHEKDIADRKYASPNSSINKIKSITKDIEKHAKSIKLLREEANATIILIKEKDIERRFCWEEMKQLSKIDGADSDDEPKQKSEAADERFSDIIDFLIAKKAKINIAVAKSRLGNFRKILPDLDGDMYSVVDDGRMTSGGHPMKYSCSAYAKVSDLNSLPAGYSHMFNDAKEITKFADIVTLLRSDTARLQRLIVKHNNEA